MTIFNAIGSISSDALSPWSVAELYHDGRQTGPAALHAILIRRPVNCCGRPTDRPASARRNLQMWLLASKSNWRVYVVRLVYELLASAPSQVPGTERSVRRISLSDLYRSVDRTKSTSRPARQSYSARPIRRLYRRDARKLLISNGQRATQSPSAPLGDPCQRRLGRPVLLAL